MKGIDAQGFHLPFILLMIMISIACYTDLKHMKIPNYLSVIGVISGVLLHTVTGQWNGFVFAAIGLMSGFIPMLMLYFCKAVGAGDVKLFAAIGALSGSMFVLQLLMYSILMAGVVGLIILITKKEVLQRMGYMLASLFMLLLFRDRKQFKRTVKHQGYLQFPFMIAVVPAILITLFNHSAFLGEAINIA